MAARSDPYRQLRFLLEIEGVVTAGFSYCDLPAATSSVVEYREGNEPPTPRKLPGLNEYGPLVLKAGVTDESIELYEWRKLVEDGLVDEARRAIAVVLLDARAQPAARWEFREAWPSQYEAPRLSATASEVAIERLVVVHEGFGRVGVAPTDAADDTVEEADETLDHVLNLPKGELPRASWTPPAGSGPLRPTDRSKDATDVESEKA